MNWWRYVILIVAVRFFCRAMLCKRGLCCFAVSVCLSVCLSRSWIVSKPVIVSSKCFHHEVAQPFWFFHTKRHGNIPTGTPPPPNGGIECRWGRQKSRFWANIWLHCVHVCCVKRSAASAVNLAATNHTEYITLVAGERPSLLMASWQETTTKCMTRSLNVTPKTTLRSG